MREQRFPVWLQVTLLTLVAFALRCYMATLDPFLHRWDEHFHALVARNMMDNPFVPILRKGQLLPYDYRQWGINTIWLHKQPLFMWQMALSMKAFGVSIFAARLPSIIMGTLMVPMLYHLCRLMRCNHFTAITAAAMHCVSYYHLEHVSGYAGMDHNDVAFSFYILASIWAYACYLGKRTWKWVVLIGVFAGCAILCKWLVGLLVYAGWGISLLCSVRERGFWREVLRMLCSLATTVAVALPWQLYILSRFPVESRYEYAHASRHIGEVVEGHGGAWDYYFDFFPKYFGDTISWLIPVGVILLLWSRQLLRPLRIAICAMMLVAIVFYSFIAQTKIYSYLMPVVPLGYIAIAYCADNVLQLIRRIPRLHIALSILVFVLFCNLSLQWGEIQSSHKADDAERVTMTANTAIYKNLKQYLRPGTGAVVNLPEWDDIDVMFFNNNLRAHGWCPRPEDYSIYTRLGIGVGVFKDRGRYNAPGYILANPSAYLIPVLLK